MLFVLFFFRDLLIRNEFINRRKINYKFKAYLIFANKLGNSEEFCKLLIRWGKLNTNSVNYKFCKKYFLVLSELQIQ